jgi:polysaccharide biosynthesis/export protein
VKGKIMNCSLSTLAFVALAGVTLAGSAAPQQASPLPGNGGGTKSAEGVPLPSGYVIGAEDVLSIVFWRDKDMSADVVVRPDGKISLPLLNDMQAAGFTPDQLRANIIKAATKFVQEPNTTVVVKEIHSRKVYVTGMVVKGGTFPLSGAMTVMQAIAIAGGLQEYADSKNIVIIRKDEGRERYFKFNYKDVLKQKNVEQNILLKPGDTVVVP